MHDLKPTRRRLSMMEIARLGGGILALLAIAATGVGGIAAMLIFVAERRGTPTSWVVGVLAALAVFWFLRWGKHRFETMAIANAPVSQTDERRKVLALKANSFAGIAVLFCSLAVFALTVFAPAVDISVQSLIVGQMTAFFAIRLAAAWYLSSRN